MTPIRFYTNVINHLQDIEAHNQEKILRISITPTRTHKVQFKYQDSLPSPKPVAVKAWKWISNFILHFAGNIITYLC